MMITDMEKLIGWTMRAEQALMAEDRVAAAALIVEIDRVNRGGWIVYGSGRIRDAALAIVVGYGNWAARAASDLADVSCNTGSISGIAGLS